MTFRYNFEDHIQLSPMPRAWGADQGRKTEIVFFLVLFLGFFQWFFTTASRYYCAMEPVRGLKESRPLDQSMLLDYLSPDPFTTVVRALTNKHFRVAWFTFLATFARTTPIVAGRILRQAPQQAEEESLRFLIEPFYFYFTTGLVALYCISLPFTRVPPPYCAPHWLATALDLYPYIYHSHLAQHYEFVTRHPLDEESHLNAQVLLTRRQYHFGLYRCEGGRRHIGISPSEYSSREGGRHRPVDKVVIKRGWLRFVYKFWYPPTIERVSSDTETPYGNRRVRPLSSAPGDEHPPDYTERPDLRPHLHERYADDRSIMNISSSSPHRQTSKTSFDSAEDLVAASTGAVQNCQQDDENIKTLTRRTTWTGHLDIDDDSELSPLRPVQHSTWPKLQHKESYT